MNAYEILHKYFLPAGLALVKREWYPKKDGSISFHATLQSVAQGQLTRINGTIHADLTVHGDTPDEVVEKLFVITKTEKMWLGPYSNYHSIIEWYAPRQQFIIRELTKEENLRKNSVL